MDGQPQPGDHRELPHDEPVALRADLPRPVAVAPVEAKADAPPTVETITDYQDSRQSPDIPPAGPALEGDVVVNEEYVSWTASEFVAHPKTAVWYGILGAVTVVLAAAGYLLTRDVVTVVVITLAAGLFGYTAARQPRELTYGVNDHGITVGPKLYPYSGFKSFSVSAEGHFSSLNFTPLKRFSPLLSVYYDPGLEDRIMQVLSAHMPYVQHQRNLVDGLMHRIRF